MFSTLRIFACITAALIGLMACTTGAREGPPAPVVTLSQSESHPAPSQKPHQAPVAAAVTQVTPKPAQAKPAAPKKKEAKVYAYREPGSEPEQLPKPDKSASRAAEPVRPAPSKAVTAQAPSSAQPSLRTQPAPVQVAKDAAAKPPSAVATRSTTSAAAQTKPPSVASTTLSAKAADTTRITTSAATKTTTQVAPVTTITTRPTATATKPVPVSSQAAVVRSVEKTGPVPVRTAEKSSPSSAAVVRPLEKASTPSVRPVEKTSPTPNKPSVKGESTAPAAPRTAAKPPVARPVAAAPAVAVERNTATDNKAPVKSVTQVESPPPAARAPASPAESSIPGLTPAANSLARQAEQQRQTGDYAGAAATLERSLRIAPREAYLWNRLARVRMEQGLAAQAGQLAARSNDYAGGESAVKNDNWRIIAEAKRRAGDAAGAGEAEKRAGND